MTQTQKPWHALKFELVLQDLKTNVDGLSLAEAQKRLARDGVNGLSREHFLLGWRLLLRQFISPLLLLLLAAAGVSLWLGEVTDATVIVAVVVLNAVIGFLQEAKANRALERLRDLVVPRVFVRRQGIVTEISSLEVVRGDVLVFHAGDRIVADARLVEARDLEIIEATLTGESLPVLKQVAPQDEKIPLAERTNLVFAGTSVAAGRGVAVVVATGMHTHLGQISELVHSTPDTQTPLQEEFRRLSLFMLVGALGIVLILFGVGIATGRAVFEMVQMSVALAVAVVPEGLPVALTVILAVGGERLLKRRALVRRLVAAETLGSVSVICSDKTGTLTQGSMEVHEFVLPSGPVRMATLGKIEGAQAMVRLMEYSMLCNDAAVEENRGVTARVIHGSPTERALMEAGVRAGVAIQGLQKRYPRVAEFPFNSTRKYGATLHEGNGHSILIVMGAPEKILSGCGRWQEEGKSEVLTVERRHTFEREAVRMAERGLRVIALGSRPESNNIHQIADPLRGLVFCGLIGLQDPLRPEAAAQVEKARRAGIRTIIVTGDHPSTAFTIGKEAGIITDKAELAVGSEMDAWDDKELERRVAYLRVFARTEPKHKIRIVQALRRRGEVVAMTGDGINDAPALKAADVGVALGSGTEVSKESADLVLLDNNLATVVAAIEQGRVIFDNLRKSVVYLLSDSFTEVVLIGGALMLGLPLPLLPLQILWINLVAHALPTIALTVEPGEADVMRRRPRPRHEPVLNRDMLLIIFVIGLVTDLVLFGVFLWLLNIIPDINTVRSILFLATGVDSLFYVFAIKNFHQPFWRTNPFSNHWLIGGVLVGFVALLAAMSIPWLQTLFELTPISLSQIGLLLMMGCIKLLAIEIAKGFLISRHQSYAS